MGELILRLGKAKIGVPQELQEIKENGFISAQYSFAEIKRMIVVHLNSNKIKSRYAVTNSNQA